MLVYILKFSACLAIFLIFYKILLEKESVHVFKRYYLLCVLLFSIGIPFITFTEYVVASSDIQPIFINDLEVITNTNWDYLTTLLWSVYGLGVLVFGILFLKNLIQILFKINQNTKVKSRRFTNVLLQNLVIPHTFFSYIFLNKHKFETKQIPKEVLLHEETHASQKHSIDVLFIEIFQVIFWFNPLIYLIKKDIKLNHEFLADQAVLINGFDTPTYQNTLLTYSSPDSYRDALHPQLANAINYSLIKKRFTVMKTKTSKKGIWLRSILLLPLLAILLFSFSTKVIVLEEKTNIAEQELTSIQEKATAKQIAEYNALAKKYNDMPEDDMIIRKKDLKRLKSLYSLMSNEQKKNAEPFPNIPPPPKVVEVKSLVASKVIEVIEIPPTAPTAPNALVASKVLEVIEVKSLVATKVIEVIEIPPTAPKVLKVIEVKNISVPPPPPIPKNATPEQKKKYEEAIKNYKLKTQKVELRKIKEKELYKVRELRSNEDRKQLQQAKLAYRIAQKVEKRELYKVRELRSEDRKQLQEAKLAYRKDQLIAREDKMKAEKGELYKVRELHAGHRKLLQEAKLVYRKAQLADREAKLKAEKKAQKNKSNKKEN